MTAPRGVIWGYCPQKKTVRLLKDIHTVLDESRRARILPLTIRQILYRLMAKGYPKSVRLYDHINNARRAANHPLHIDFDDIVDGKGSWKWPVAYEDADDVMSTLKTIGARARTHRQTDQDRYLVGWCEAQGLLPQLAPFAHDRGMPMISSGGYDSTTVREKVARLHSEWDRPWTILHVGDLDTHGDQIFTALKEDLEAWARHYGRSDIEVVRVAVTEAQRVLYSLPGDPDDPKKVQVEAMPPAVLRDVWREAITSRQDAAKFQARLDFERDMRAEVTERLDGAS